MPVAGDRQRQPITVIGQSAFPSGRSPSPRPNYNNTYNAVVAIDWNISDKDQIRGRYFYNRSVGLDFNAALPVFFEPSPNVNNSVSISEFHNFSATMENELRVSYSRNNQNIGAGNFKFPGLDVFPNLSFDDLQLQIGPDPNTPSGSIENLSQFQENLTKTWGRHTFKAGFNMSDVILTGFFVQRARGDYDYASRCRSICWTSSPAAVRSAECPANAASGTANGVPFGFLQNAAYFNDDFRVRPNLTLNLGVRYEYVTVPVGSRAQAVQRHRRRSGRDHLRLAQVGQERLVAAHRFRLLARKERRSGRSAAASAGPYDNTYINLDQNASPAYYQTTVDVNDSQPVSNFLANGGLTARGAGRGAYAGRRARGDCLLHLRPDTGPTP